MARLVRAIQFCRGRLMSKLDGPQARAMTMEGKIPFGVYIHWPFCAAKCPYCDFNSHVRASLDEDGWVDVILRELEWVAASQTQRPPVETVFFGGGTPSLMQGQSVGRVLQKIAALWP